MASAPSGPELPYFVESLDPGQPTIQSKYKPGFILRDADHPGEAKLAEFRTNNRKLNTEKAELEAAKAELENRLKAYADIDPEQARVALAAVAAQTAAEATHKARVAELEGSLERERAEHAKTKLAHGIASAFLALGGLPAAREFVVAKGLEVFKPGKNGEPTTSEYSPTDPGAPLSVHEWLTAQIGAIPFAFAPSRGGGATHSQAGPAARAPRVISSDPLEFGKHLESIAKGDVVVC